MNYPSFSPPPWAQNQHLQTIAGSLNIRAMGENPMVNCAVPVIVNGGDDIRLQGFYSHHSHNKGKALIMLLHGWEGSASSTHVLHAGKFFFNLGFDIFRLNLRDHGDSHDLNIGLFHGALLDEVIRATAFIAELSPEKPFFIIGFSLGGNFALRISFNIQRTNINNLRHIFSISPVINPHKTTQAIDKGFFLYRTYFLNKWKQSLIKKQQAFPAVYDFEMLSKMKTILDVTQEIIPRYTAFKDLFDYFRQYTLGQSDFIDLSVPATIITAADDPFIPAEDFLNLDPINRLTIFMHSHGGHCAFLDPFPFKCWYEQAIYDIIKKESLG